MLLLLLVACAAVPTATPVLTPSPTAVPDPTPTAAPTATSTPAPTPVPTSEPTPEPTPVATPKPTATPTPAPTPTPKPVQKGSGKLIVIDAGHQAKANHDKEPVGPGASETKYKVSSGTYGVSTKTPEYKVTLLVSLKLRDILRARGYEVLMIRETNEVNISNSERAAIANNADADAFLRIHCNGTDSASVKGALTLCPSADNPYCPEIYDSSRRLASCVLDWMCRSTGAKNRGVEENDTMSGINWCKVPVTLIEMGYMSNPEEDALLCSNAYQDKLAAGIADGVDAFFGN